MNAYLMGMATAILGLLALIVVLWIILGRINLEYLISDEAGDASMSRFQLLIFTFIVAIGLVEVLNTTGKFPDIPNSILLLVGVSGSTYAIGKAVGAPVEEEANAQAPPKAKGLFSRRRGNGEQG